MHKIAINEVFGGDSDRDGRIGRHDVASSFGGGGSGRAEEQGEVAKAHLGPWLISPALRREQGRKVALSAQAG